MESDADGVILSAKMSPGGDYVFYSAKDNGVIKGKEPTNAMHLGIFEVDEEDDEEIMEAEDEDLENVGFGLYFNDGEHYTLPIFMYDADQLYVNELKTEDYHVFEIEE